MRRREAYETLKHAKSERLVPPFPEMLGEVPQETHLEKLAHNTQHIHETSPNTSPFTHAFLRGQSNYGHAFPDEHLEVFFFPFCCNMTSSEAEIDAALSELIENGFFDGWYETPSFDKFDVLFYEYEVFGMCTGMSVKEYFEKAREAFESLRLDELMFEKSGIAPGLDNVQIVSEARAAIREVVDAQVAFQCVWDKDLKKNLLQQVWVCYDKAFKLIDCPLALQSEESCTRTAKTLDGKDNIELLDFYVPKWEDVLEKKVAKDEL